MYYLHLIGTDLTELPELYLKRLVLKLLHESLKNQENDGGGLATMKQ